MAAGNWLEQARLMHVDVSNADLSFRCDPGFVGTIRSGNFRTEKKHPPSRVPCKLIETKGG